MSQTNPKIDLDTALRGAFENRGFHIEAAPAALPHQKSFFIRKTGDKKLVGVVNLDPHTSKSTSCSSNSADDRTISVISLSMNLDQPPEGEQAKLNDGELQMLFKLCGHAISQLGVKHHQDGAKVEKRFLEFTSQLKPSA